MTTIVLWMCALAGVLATAQDPQYPIPDDLLVFWEPYWEAKQLDDEDAMDGVADLHSQEGEAVLDIFLDQVSRVDEYELYSELRTLAWCLDRALFTSRYIERVRFVLDLPLRSRRQRADAILEFNRGLDLRDRAQEEKSEVAFDAATETLRSAFAKMQDVGDIEFSIFATWELAVIEQRRGRDWEQARYLMIILELAEKLSFLEPLVDDARQALANLKEAGIDPEAEPPAEGEGDRAGEEAGGTPASGGLGLTAYAAGSKDLEFPLKFIVPKKGISGVALPSFEPPDQYQLWRKTWLAADGPSDWDSLRLGMMKPGEHLWKLVRRGAEFGIDSDEDGETDVWFTPNSSPKRIEVPGDDPKQPYPVMVCIMGDREQMFGLEVNYSPQPSGARLRFGLACALQARVLGETWTIYDTNLTGAYGDSFEFWDDLVTEFEDDNHVSWWEVDAVRLGKGKVALPWSPVLPVDGGFYRAMIEPDGSRVVLRELNLKTGFVKVEIDTAVAPSHLLIREAGMLEGATFNVVPGRKGAPVEVPVGKYQLVFGRIATGKRTSLDQVRIYTGRSLPFQVRPGGTVELKVGAPYRLEFKTYVEGREAMVDTRTLRVYGRGGEEYASFFDEALQPLLEVRTASGKKIQKAKRMRQCDIAAWQENKGADNILWFPQEPRFEVPEGETLQFRMTQPSHVLIGGPLESDWIP